MNDAHQCSGKCMGKSESITFEEYQEEASKTAVYPSIGDNLYYPALGLAGEAGEVCEKIKKIMRDDGGEVSIEKAADLVKEIGDVLWYVAALCEELDICMGTAAAINLAKLKARQEKGTLKGSGDNR
jgi:NTP pyrophosphatase (non-canonical NTP hydrolase)